MPMAALALAALLRECAPNVGARTMTAIIQVESGGNYLAIHDNNLHREFDPVDQREAVAWAQQLLRLRHSIDLGIAQINSGNLPTLGMSVADAFDPCSNVRGGATILSYDYIMATRTFGAGQFALRRALGAYNTGSIFAGEAYVDRILAAAGLQAATSEFRVPDLHSVAPVVVNGASATPRPLPAGVPFAPLVPIAGIRPVPSLAAAPASPYSSPILVAVPTPVPPSPSPTPAAPASAAPAPSPTSTPTAPPATVVLPPAR